MKHRSDLPPGRDEARVQHVLEHQEVQTESEAVVEDEASHESTTHTAVEIPVDVLPAIRELIAKENQSA